MTLPPNTYGVRCEFHPGSSRYTYLVDGPHHGEIVTGDHVVVASPKGGYKVILVTGHADDLAPVDLKYMKYVVQKVEVEVYNTLMHNLLAGDEKASSGVGTATVLGTDTIARPPTSPLIDEEDTSDVDEPGAPPKHHLDDLGGFE